MLYKDTPVKDFLYEIQKAKDSSAFKETKGSILENRKNILNLNILVGIDISGSISAGQVRQFMQQLDKIRGLSRVKVIEIDSKIVAMYDYFKANQNRVVRICGGGGTMFADLFRVAKQINPDAILMMTDGEVFDSVRDPGIRTGWVLTHNGVHPYGFGDVILRLPAPASG